MNSAPGPPQLSKEELRARRLAALTGTRPPPVSTSTSTSSPPPSSEHKKPRQTSPPHRTATHPDVVMTDTKPTDDEDNDLARAIAMSIADTSGPESDLKDSSGNNEPGWLTDTMKPEGVTWGDSASISAPSNNMLGTGGEDDDIAKAIALSLEESKRQDAAATPGFEDPTFTATPQTNSNVETAEDRNKRIASIYGAADSTAFERVMWGSTVTEGDKERWRMQGIAVASCWLRQSHGGPCGVLAVLGGEMVRWFLFGASPGVRDMFLGELEGVAGRGKGDSKLDGGDSKLKGVPADVVDRAVAVAIGAVLARAAMRGVEGREGGVRVITSNDPGAEGACKAFWVEGSSAVDVEDRLAEDVASYLLSRGKLKAFKEPGGVLLVAKSLVATRGAAQIADDMDDPHPQCAFTAQFGHCSQELINLLLSGAATSNVFDGVKDMGGLVMKGCLERPDIGYLTQIEALRYCSVGTYLKTPKKPIWVIGSSSHFTILFALDMAPITESNSDQILEKCRRAFKVVDGDENGFIQMTSLRDVLLLLDLMDKVGEAGLPRLADSLEESGCGIILWDAFWKACSRLLTGASLESVLEKDDAVIAVDSNGVALPNRNGEGIVAEEKKLNFETDQMGDQFILYHYNGLREGTMTPFGVQRLSAEDAVGASVAMNTAGSGGGGGMDRGLEEVARTRWPSAKFEWFEKSPPSID